MNILTPNSPPTQPHNSAPYKQIANRLFRAALIINPIVLDVAYILLVSIVEKFSLQDTFSIPPSADTEFGRPIWFMTAGLIIAGLFFLQKSRS